MSYFRKTLIAVCCGLALLIFSPIAAAQPHMDSSAAMARLAEPGNAIFAAVQEVIHKVETDTTVDWSAVNLERLRQHLVDMHRVATEVEIVYQHAIENGVRIRVEPANGAAYSALARVLRRHPAQLEQETGWAADVEAVEGGYELQVTTTNSADVAKIRALGYIGLLTHGAHHQRHHWAIVTGQE